MLESLDTAPGEPVSLALAVRLKREPRPVLFSPAEAARPKLDDMVVAERTHSSVELKECQTSWLFGRSADTRVST